MTPVIETAALSKMYGSTAALKGLNLRIERGEIFGLIGPNGAGKTTTMRLLLDLIRPSSGHVRVFGQEPRAGGKSLRARLAFLPGELKLASMTTGRDLLSFYARLAGDTPASVYEGLAERLGLDLTMRVGTLSKGNKQKLGLVQAFMRPAELLILDEPTSGLDPVMQREFLELVREARAAGRTVLLSSHVLSEIQQVAGRVGILRRGELVTLESVASLRAGAPRRVRLSAEAAELPQLRTALEALPGISGIDTQPASAEGTGDVIARYAGPPAPLLALVSSLPITDLVLAEPDLEEAVLAHYSSSSSGTATPDGRQET